MLLKYCSKKKMASTENEHQGHWNSSRNKSFFVTLLINQSSLEESGGVGHFWTLGRGGWAATLLVRQIINFNAWHTVWLNRHGVNWNICMTMNGVNMQCKHNVPFSSYTALIFYHSPHTGRTINQPFKLHRLSSRVESTNHCLTSHCGKAPTVKFKKKT